MAEPGVSQWLTFDVYSALFDFRASLLREFCAVCSSLDGEQRSLLLDLWRSRQLALAMPHALLQRGHLPFRHTTRLALESALTAFNLSLSESARALLVTV